MVLAAVVGCSTVKTSADDERSTDFSKHMTWSWKADGSIQDPILSKRVPRPRSATSWR
ncbi:MAG: hypothetical protein ACM3SU_05145 [Acidobacteriota bacterium]